MKSEDLQRSAKLFCENIKVAYTPEYFVMAVTSGSQGQTYALTPAHAKRLQQYLTFEIEKFEKAHGEITAEWNPNIVSPVQGVRPPNDQS